MYRNLVCALLLTYAGCGGPTLLPAPCTGVQLEAGIASGSDGTFVMAAEQLPAGSFLRHFDGSGQPLTQLQLPSPTGNATFGDIGYEGLYAGGSALFAVDFEGGVSIWDDSGFRSSVTAPIACTPPTGYPTWFAVEGDRLRIYGKDEAEHLCTYRVDGNGVTDDAHIFDNGEYGFAVQTVAGGGFVVNATEGIILYDANGVRLWTHAGAFGQVTAVGGQIYALSVPPSGSSGAINLVLVGAGGQGETVLTSSTVGSDQDVQANVFAALADGTLVVELETRYAETHEVVHVDATGAVTRQPVAALNGQAALSAAVGADYVLLQTKQGLYALDPDGAVRWQVGAVIGSAIASDGGVVAVSSTALDACRAALTLDHYDAQGNHTWTWSAR